MNIRLQPIKVNVVLLLLNQRLEYLISIVAVKSRYSKCLL
jgi:hypothetical protein